MPHLQFDVNIKLDNKKRKIFLDFIRTQFSKIMRTGEEHIAISLREFPKNSLSLGRADSEDYVCFMNLDVREGRSMQQKRDLVKKYMEGVRRILGIDLSNQYITYTLHQGNDFNLYEKSLKEWSDNDNPIT